MREFVILSHDALPRHTRVTLFSAESHKLLLYIDLHVLLFSRFFSQSATDFDIFQAGNPELLTRRPRIISEESPDTSEQIAR